MSNGKCRRAIQTFARVVDTGSVSVAARIQSIGQPAVSKAIAQPEDCSGGFAI
jgi:DNA-binding transcriptional LysR family regulator